MNSMLGRSRQHQPFVAAGPPSRPPHWDCSTRRCDLGAALRWPPQPTWYLLDHAPRRRPAFVDRGDTRWDFLGVGPHHLQSLPFNADRSRESGGLLWRPRFLISIISATNQINRVRHCWHWSNLGQPGSSPRKPSQQSPVTLLIKYTHPFGQTLVKP
jgi:hypothetical protein